MTETLPATEHFGLALAAFVDALQLKINDHFTRYANLTPDTVTTEPGNVYVKVILVRDGMHGRSVHSFIRISDGAILKAAGWKAPFKGKTIASTIRGSIFADDHGMSAVTHHGAVYLK